ncbi:MAG: cation diffusion facilitator family transporter [Desulfomonilia bacterium]|nr:cation diffusion facilitator family transporter [Desulfomonilia bacterium]
MDLRHDHSPRSYNKAFLLAVLLNAGFVIVEAAAGIIYGSLALVADAAHNVSDVFALLLAWTASYMGKLRPTRTRTYGWRSSTILASLFNAILLMLVLGGIIWESFRRLQDPAPVPGMAVIITALIGLLINTGTALLFLSGRKRDLNIRAAFIHMAADAGVSAGVLLAGFVILFTGAFWVDPVISLAIAGIILIGTWGLLKDSLNLALQAVPAGIDPAEVRAYLLNLPGVTSVHDLHIWAMSTTEVALTAHLVSPDHAGDDEVITRASKELLHHYGIHHTTLQWERSTGDKVCCSTVCEEQGERP